jgi:hypothetical protein
MIFEESIIYLIKSVAWIGENFPDNPHLARRLLMAGGLLLSASWYLAESSWRDSTFSFRRLCLIAGIGCGFLGLFVFFRRAVWWRQEKTGSGLTSLDLSGRNNPAGSRVSTKEASEYIFGDSPG